MTPALPPHRGPVSLRPAVAGDGLVMLVHDARDRHVSEALWRDGCWEPLESRVLRAALATGDAVLDAGANIGYFTLLAARAVGATGRVYAFEPEPDNHALLAANVRLNALPQVRLFDCALSDTAGTAALYLSAHNLGDHSLAAAPGTAAIPVRCCRADAVLPADLRLALIKADVQGAEPAVLTGLGALLEASLPTVRLLLEFCPGAMDRVRPGAAEGLLDWLQTTGLPVFVMDQMRDVLVETSVAHLWDWLRACRQDADADGFFNLLVGEAPAGIRCLPACGC